MGRFVGFSVILKVVINTAWSDGHSAFSIVSDIASPSVQIQHGMLLVALFRVLELVGEPVEPLVEAVSACCTGGLDVPVPLSEGV